MTCPFLSPSTYLWFLVGQLYLDFWVDHPVWFGDYSRVVLDNLYHHYVQTKDYGSSLFFETMRVTMIFQIVYLLSCCWRSSAGLTRPPATADGVSLVCSALLSLCFLTLIAPHRDAMSDIGKAYQTDDRRRLEFISHVNGLTQAHFVCLVLCLAGIVADYFASNSRITTGAAASGNRAKDL